MCQGKTQGCLGLCIQLLLLFLSCCDRSSPMDHLTAQTRAYGPGEHCCGLDASGGPLTTLNLISKLDKPIAFVDGETSHEAVPWIPRQEQILTDSSVVGAQGARGHTFELSFPRVNGVEENSEGSNSALLARRIGPDCLQDQTQFLGHTAQQSPEGLASDSGWRGPSPTSRLDDNIVGLGDDGSPSSPEASRAVRLKQSESKRRLEHEIPSGKMQKFHQESSDTKEHPLILEIRAQLSQNQIAFDQGAEIVRNFIVEYKGLHQETSMRRLKDFLSAFEERQDLQYSALCRLGGLLTLSPAGYVESPQTYMDKAVFLAFFGHYRRNSGVRPTHLREDESFTYDQQYKIASEVLFVRGSKVCSDLGVEVQWTFTNLLNRIKREYHTVPHHKNQFSVPRSIVEALRRATFCFIQDISSVYEVFSPTQLNAEEHVRLAIPEYFRQLNEVWSILPVFRGSRNSLPPPRTSGSTSVNIFMNAAFIGECASYLRQGTPMSRVIHLRKTIFLTWVASKHGLFYVSLLQFSSERVREGLFCFLRDCAVVKWIEDFTRESPEG